MTTHETQTAAALPPIRDGVGGRSATERADLARIRVEGPLTVASAARLRRLIRGYATLGDVRLLVDLAAVSAVDACGIAALLDGLRVVRAHEGGELTLRVNETVRAALKRSGTVSQFTLSGN
jgi:anti-anti-sigma factor